METITIAVKLKDSFEGLAESSGLLSWKQDVLHLQFQTKDAILGVIKSELKHVDIPLAHIEELEVKTNMLANKIYIKVDDLTYLQEIPSCDTNELVLKIDRGDREKAVDLIRAIRLDMSEKEYQQALQD